METILDWLPVGVFILDSEFKVVRVNSAIEQFFGIPRQDMIGRDKRTLIRERIHHIFHRPDACQQRVVATYDNNTYIEKFIAHVLQDGERQDRWLEHYSQPITEGVYAGGRVELYTDISERVVADEHISWLASHFMQLQEQEKARIARDLHDELGQSVVAQKMMIESVMRSLDSGLVGEAQDRLLMIKEELSRVGHEIRRISSDLMPSMLEPLGLQETLVWMTSNFKNIYGIQVEFECMGFNSGKRLPPNLEIALFRVFQEGMNNIVKHSQAKTVQLKLLYSYPKIIASIRDDGRGFCLKSNSGGMGLRFMRQRVAEVGGALRIKTACDRGTVIRVEVPYFERQLDEIAIEN